ncbi:MAG: DNA polymerase III subunit beta, partial [Bdellovibrio sp.]
SGVYFEESPQDGYAMVATDGHRLSMIRKKISGQGSALQGAPGVIIPRKGLMEVKKLVENSGGEFELLVEGSQLVVRQGETVLMVRLIEGKFPNYNQFIPKNLKQKIKVPRESFLSSLRRVSLMANQKSKAISIALSNGKMEITSNNPELGDAKEEIEVDYQGQDLKIGFNAKYIQEVLTAIQDEQVDLEFNDHLSPGLVRPHDDPNYTCVVMPMRI